MLSWNFLFSENFQTAMVAMSSWAWYSSMFHANLTPSLLRDYCNAYYTEGAFGWSESFRPAGWIGWFPSCATVHLSAATVFLSHKTSRCNVLASFFQTSERGLNVFLRQIHGAWLPPWLATHAAHSMVRVDLKTIPLWLLSLITFIVLLCRRWCQITGMNMGNLPLTACCRRCRVSSL